MTIWKYQEEKETHLLVKFYKEDHGEGEYLGDLDEARIKQLILEVKPDVKIEQAYGTLAYFGMLPLLVFKKKS
ncbi:MAG: hypothetical protein IE918_07190 [Campylobacterales bacterium]|nr:hypothetical protein [Campylobacterales bacterium]